MSPEQKLPTSAQIMRPRYRAPDASHQLMPSVNERHTDRQEALSRLEHGQRRPESGWLRALYSLRLQLTLAFTALLALFLLLLSMLVYNYVTVRYSIGAAGNLSAVMLIAGIVTVVIGGLAAFWVVTVLLKPLREMRDAAQAISLGDLRQRVHLPRGDDEVGDLARSLNKMVDQLEHACEEQRAMEERTRRFISDASHELRTPLTSLRGFTDVLMRGAKDDAAALQRSLQLMKNETERMSRLINDLLTLARLDEGMPLQIVQVDLVDMAEEAVEQARLLARDGRDVSLRKDVQEEHLLVMADEDRLRQVLLILFDNAIKYGRPGAEGWILLVLDREDDFVLIRVSDNGRGVKPEDQPYIFERFYRGKQTPTSYAGEAPIEGAGLGLSIALAIVHAHQGRMKMESEFGKGATFTVALPLFS